jgi:hypothetical protein
LTNDSSTRGSIDDQIAYHKEMEHAAIRAGDFTKAEHHRKMQEICQGLKEKQQSNKTPEQLSDEDYKVGPTSADKERMPG